jgi:hypothetical protein
VNTELGSLDEVPDPLSLNLVDEASRIIQILEAVPEHQMLDELDRVTNEYIQNSDPARAGGSHLDTFMQILQQGDSSVANSCKIKPLISPGLGFQYGF